MPGSLVASLLLLASPLPSPADSTATQRFDALVQRHMLQRARRDPEWATSVGIQTYNSRLTDRTAAAYHSDSVRLAGEHAVLLTIDTAKLDERRRVDWLVLESVLRVGLHDHGLRNWERRPAAYLPFNAIHHLAVSTTPGPAARMGQLRSRLQAWPAALAAGRRQLKPARTPKFWIDLDAGSARRVATWLKNDLPPMVVKQGGNTLAFRTSLDAAVRATEAWAAFLADSLAQQATGDWRTGSAEYDWRLANSKMIDQTAASLITLGYEAFHETERDLAALAKTIDPTRTWRQLADSSKMLHPHADSIFAAYSAENARARAFVVAKQLVSVPPQERLDMILTPPHLRQTYAYGGYWAAAPFEKTRVGRFFVTPVEEGWTDAQVQSKLRGHNYGWITVVSVHEGYPGHHLQTVHTANQPSQVRKVYGSEIFGEGWGLYSEEMMYRHGFFPSPLARLTQLRMRLWRAARVIIDPSIHTGRWTMDEAVQFFVDSVGLERADAVAEVTRYTTWPTQAVSYLIGMREIDRLRADAQKQLGASFNERRFHDTVLRQGSLPPPLMRRAVLPALKRSP